MEEMAIMEFDSFCELFAFIEKDPFAPIGQFTLGDFFRARFHLNECTKCRESSDRVLAKYPKDDDGKIGFNVN